MKDRLRRKRKSSGAAEPESTGKVGQQRPVGEAQPLQPDYLEAFSAQKPAVHETPPPPPEPEVKAREPRIEVELQPESPATPPAPASEAIGHAPARKPKGVVVLAIGLPGSGKTTWFGRRGVTPLSSDMLRSVLFDDVEEQRYQGLVFSTLRSLLRARLIARMPWNYVDATNLSPRERRQWIHMARGLGYEVHAVFFDVPLEVCLERNRRRDRVVPEDALRRMAAKLRPPKFEEGFSKIVVVRVKRKEGESGAT
ncbi:MAG TPA: ATP-binding protein, partial [Terriglobales bacterium]|nr:ATP-binding protein [Terriglobales bacterium]